MKRWFKSHVCISLLCICLVIMFVTGLIVSSTLSNNGNYLVRETRIQNDGYTLTGTLYIPKVALEKDDEISTLKNGNNINKVPAIITQGGGSANRYFQQGHIVELVKRGFVVFALDAYTHGESDNYVEGWGVYSHVHDAIEYVHSLNFVDKTKVGYFGHSQGGSATMMALKVYAGYYTLADEIFNMMHDELGVEITREQVEAQDPDEVAATLDDKDLGYYEARKQEIEDSYYDLRISYGVVEGMANGAAPPLANGETNTITPMVVEVGGVPVFRDIQANIATSLSYTDEAVGVNALGAMGLTGADQLASAELIRLVYGTGEENVQYDTLYSVNMTASEEQPASTVIGSFDENSWQNSEVQAAAENKSLRLLSSYTGWHNTSHYSQKDISNVANFMCIASGYNNGFISETGGANAVDFNDTHTWKTTVAANAVAFFTLIVFAAALLGILLKTKSFAATNSTLVAPQTSKKSVITWVFTAVVVILPALLITPLMNHSLFPASVVAKFDRINPIAFWSLSCAVLLLILIIVKWKVYDKKNTELRFRDFYGLNCSVKSVLLTLLAVFIVSVAVTDVINLYYEAFNGANFMIAMPLLHIPIQFTPISADRYFDWICYFIYFLPYWIIGSMLVNSARMKDMSDWLNSIILSVINFIPLAIFVYVQYFGYLGNGGSEPILGISWATLIQMQGLVLIVPVSVFVTRALYKRTGSCLPGAICNAMLFSLPFMCNVIAYTVSSLPTYN